MKPSGPCILVYNPISGHGHLDSWNALFVSFLLQEGWRVIALTPDVDDLRVRLTDKGLAACSSLQILPWDALRRSFVQRILGRVKRLFKQQKTLSQDDPEANYLKPLEFALRVKKALKQTKWQPEVVFNMYMDLYRTDATSWQAFDAICQLPWSGIRFVPRQDPTEAYYRSPSLFGMCFLDESICEQYRASLPKKTFEYLPDITESALPSQPSDIAQKIKALAKGRKTVFLGGTIGGGKNLARWYALIQRADPAKWFFLQIGEVHLNSLTPEDIAARQRVMQDMPENLFIHPAYLPDEKTFNEIIQLSDVLFAVYRNFRISSNMPGKAAAFDRPILVAKDYLMGQRVTSYGIGLAVPEDDVAQMQAALEMLVRDEQIAQMRDRFRSYRNDFSIEALQHRFVNYLKNGLNQRVEDRS
ncbi:glycosyltransferase family 4 protein [Orrella sp. NBD-18]|uniref:Glycosyltransferase family 4 protein n=1 Tax=Sheuella amnicola TaxID=2707330 RepID=A0A6B2R1I5_9BURK|nr:glycosyltransferase family 4 protein [Sheuella amnicola]NDY83494.1 glycosyltransferase family 4 protein [Sheuella amnicola]